MNKRKLLSLIFFLFLQAQVHSQSSGNDGWFWQYPKPQGNDLRDIYIFDSLKAIAVGALGTVIKTNDGGKTWDVQHHAGGTEIDLNNVHFTDSLYGWACGGTYFSNKNVLLKTTDGGKNWETVNIDNSLPLNAVYFMNQDTGIVVGEDGIVLRTIDGGDSWDIRKMDNYIGYYLDIFVLSEITFTDSQNGWIVGAGYYGNELYRTTDAGETWQWNELIILPKYFAGIVDICFTDEKHGFIIGDYEGFFAKTTDGGVTWQQQNLIEKYPEIGNDPFFTSLAFTDSLNGWIIGGNYFERYILKTTDGCESWEEVNADEIKNRWLHKIRLSEQSDGKTGWIVGQYGSIYKKSGESENWIEQSDEMLSFQSVHFFDEYFGCAVGWGKIYTTEDAGNTWVKRIQSDSLELRDVKITDNQNIIIVGALKGEIPYSIRGIILHSTNHGQDWNRIVYDTLSIFNSITLANDTNYWIAAGKALLRSTNKGNSWEIFPAELERYPVNLQFINENVGWGLIVGESNLLKTVDCGKNWITQRVDSNIDLRSFCFLDVDNGFAVSGTPGKNIYKTTDGGNTWKLYPIPLFYLNTVYFIDSLIGWAAGIYMHGREFWSIIVKTTNGGIDWFEQKCPLREEVSEIFFINKNIGWAVGPNGIIKTKSGGDIVLIINDESSNNIPESFYLYQNYPNPFNSSTIIKYEIKESDFVSLSVYDILGRLVKTLVNNHRTAGNHLINLDASKLSSGIYFYRLTSNGLSITRKMILLR